MNRVEEIKHNFNISKAGIAMMDEAGMRQHVMSMQREYVDHVEYLLTKLEMAEKALEEIEDESSRDDSDITQINGLAQDTLTAIRS